jgi:hypothetical protein
MADISQPTLPTVEKSSFAGAVKKGGQMCAGLGIQRMISCLNMIELRRWEADLGNSEVNRLPSWHWGVATELIPRKRGNRTALLQKSSIIISGGTLLVAPLPKSMS